MDALWQRLVSIPFLVALVVVVLIIPDQAEAVAPTAEKNTKPIYLIELRGNAFVPQPDATSKSIESLQKFIKADSKRSKQPRAHALLQLWKPVTPDVRAKLREQGVTLLEPLGALSYRVSITAPGVKILRDNKSIRWVSEILPKWKAEPAVIEGKLYSYQIRANQRAAYTVIFHGDVDLDEARATVNDIGGVIETEDTRAYVLDHSLIVQISPKRLADLLSRDAVAWIESSPPPNTPDNINSQALSRVNTVQAAPYNLTGTGISVGVWDQGVASAHGDFGNRVTAQDTEAVNGQHATHVTGTIAGNGTGNANAEGMAPAVNVSSYGWTSDAAEMTAAATSTGAAGSPPHITASSHSYGPRTGWDAGCVMGFCGNQNLFGQYTADSRSMDNQVATNGLVVMRAAGNDRDDADPDPANPPNNAADCQQTFAAGVVGDCILPPAAAKNVIAVGAVDRNGNMSGFSGWGPTDDGRIKPDVVADGVGVISTTPDIFRDLNADGVDDYLGEYATFDGTSMATPAVTGTVTLMMQQANALNMTLRPSSYKALLIQTARDAGAVGPDYQNGWGIVDAQASADLLRRNDRPCVRENSVSVIGANGTIEFPMCVGPNQTELHVTLVWDDTAAAAGVANTLVNDLDLRLIDSNNNTHTPWTLNPANPAQAALRDGPGANDAINNVEQVSVLNPVAGAWRVRVSATQLPGAAQNFSVAGVCFPDADLDEVIDCRDNCPAVLNRNQADLDGDGIGDMCDNDMDGDGVPNVADNCLMTPNLDQANLDRDSRGDACDEDKDGDCVANNLDNCPVTANCNYYAAQADHNLCADPCRSAIAVKYPVRELVGALVFACTRMPVNPECFIDGCPWPGFREVPGMDITPLLTQLADPRYREITGVLPGARENIILPETGTGFVNGMPLDLGNLLGVRSLDELRNKQPDKYKQIETGTKASRSALTLPGNVAGLGNIWGLPPHDRDLLCISIVDDLKDQLQTANNEYQACVQRAKTEAAQCQADSNRNGIGDACDLRLPRPPRGSGIIP